MSKRNRTAIAKRQFLEVIDSPFENDEFLSFQDSTNEFKVPEHIEKKYYRGKSALSFVQLLATHRQWNVIKVKVWAHLMPIWALVPLRHYIAWLVPLWVNTFLPSNTLARPSLIVQNGRKNGTEWKSSKDSFEKLLIPHLKMTNF